MQRLQSGKFPIRKIWKVSNLENLGKESGLFLVKELGRFKGIILWHLLALLLV